MKRLLLLIGLVASMVVCRSAQPGYADFNKAQFIAQPGNISIQGFAFITNNGTVVIITNIYIQQTVISNATIGNFLGQTNYISKFVPDNHSLGQSRIYDPGASNGPVTITGDPGTNGEGITTSGWYSTTNLANGQVNVKAFGAKGDGLTDDTTAFRNAIAATGQGGCVFVPGATNEVYLLSGALTIPTSFTLRGSGHAFNYSGSEPSGPTLRWVAGHVGIWMTNRSSQLDGLVLDGNSVLSNIVEEAYENHIIRNCFVGYATNAAVHLGDWINKNVIDNCFLGRSGYGLVSDGLNSTDFTVSNTEVGINTIGGFYIASGSMVRLGPQLIFENNAGIGLEIHPYTNSLDYCFQITGDTLYFENNKAGSIKVTADYPRFLGALDFRDCQISGYTGAPTNGLISIESCYDLRFDKCFVNEGIVIRTNQWGTSSVTMVDCFPLFSVLDQGQSLSIIHTPNAARPWAAFEVMSNTNAPLFTIGKDGSITNVGKIFTPSTFQSTLGAETSKLSYNGLEVGAVAGQLNFTNGMLGLNVAPKGILDVYNSGSNAWTYLRGNVNGGGSPQSVNGLAIGFNMTGFQGEVDYVANNSLGINAQGHHFYLYDGTNLVDHFDVTTNGVSIAIGLSVASGAATINMSGDVTGNVMTGNKFNVGSSATITTGAGVPASGEPDGSIYLRTDGSMWLRTNSTWVIK